MKHLSEEQIAQWMAGERSSEAEAHVAGCDRCRAEVAAFAGVLAQFRNSSRSGVFDRQPTFYAGGRERRRMVWPRLAVAAAALALLIAAPLYRQHQEQQRAILALQDAQLLQQVDAEISQKVPDAMDPLANLMSSNLGSTERNLNEEQK